MTKQTKATISFGSLTTYKQLEQRTPEWHTARAGILTASSVGKLITPKTLKLSEGETAHNLTATLTAERLTGRIVPTHTTDAMWRGIWDEPIARDLYSAHVAPVNEVGFMTREITIDEAIHSKVGYSPDGLVGDDGLIEIKSKTPAIQLRTITTGEIPLEHIAQLQMGLMVSDRKWIDYVSFSGGMPLFIKRMLPDGEWQEVICEAIARYEIHAQENQRIYKEAEAVMIPTEIPVHYYDDDDIEVH